MIKKSSDGKVQFYEKSHKYKLKKRYLTGVTTFLGQFFEKFDANKMAKLKAFLAKRAGEKGKGVRYWKKLWKESAEHGTRVHSLIEEIINRYKINSAVSLGLNPRSPDTLDTRKTGQALNYLNGVLEEGWTDIKTEEILYDEELGLAGQVDLIIEDNGVLNIYDYKTNKTINLLGYKGKRDKERKKAKKPISHLDDCNYQKYTLQMSLYAYMLERKGYKIGTLTLLHLKENEVVPYKCYYLKEEIEKLLKYVAEKRNI